MPFRIADRAIAPNPLAELIEVAGDLVAIDDIEPVLRSRNWPLRDRYQIAIIANRIETRPVPFLSTIDQSLPQRVTLDVSADPN